MDTCDRLAGNLRRYIEKLGVESGLIMVKDPDSGETVTLRFGDDVWIAGAIHLQDAAIIEDFRRCQTPVEDDAGSD